MALDPRKALTEPERVRRALGLSSFSADEFAFVEDTIGDLSEEAENVLNRGALCYDEEIVEFARSGGGQRIYVRRRPILELLSVYDAEDDGSYDVDADVIDTSEVQIEKEGRTGCLYRRSGWPFTGNRSDGPAAGDVVESEGANLRVAYRGGWVLPLQATADLPRTLPRDLEAAIVSTVVDAWGMRGTSSNIASTSALTGSVTFVNKSTRAEAGGLGSFGPEAMAVLNSYRRVAMGRTP